MSESDLFQAPEDWPGAGPIDLDAHDPPHTSSTTEWWYVNSHLVTATGRTMSLFASFFRIVSGREEDTGAPIHAHSLTWALVDVEKKKYWPESRVDRSAPELGLKKVDRGEGSNDPRLRRAMREVLVKGHVPYPDRMFEGEVKVATDRLDLDFDGQRLRKLDDGSYQLSLYHDHFDIAVELNFNPRKPPARHGDDGVVKSVHGEDMFYYFIPRCGVNGELHFGKGKDEPKDVEFVLDADGWYDHEFGCHTSKHGETFALDAGEAAPVSEFADGEQAASETDGESVAKHDIAWNWIGAQLDDGSEVSTYALHDLVSDECAGRWAVVIHADGTYTSLTDVHFEPSGLWRSTRSFNDYPTDWELERRVRSRTRSSSP